MHCICHTLIHVCVCVYTCMCGYIMCANTQTHQMTDISCVSGIQSDS